MNLRAPPGRLLAAAIVVLARIAHDFIQALLAYAAAARRPLLWAAITGLPAAVPFLRYAAWPR